VVRNARIPDRDSPVDIGVSDQMIESIGHGLEEGEREIQADSLVDPGFVDVHVHLDKALIVDELPPNRSGTLEEAISIIHDAKRNYTVKEVRQRAEDVIRMHVRNGCPRIRTHVDVDTIGGLTPLEGVLEARRACQDIADVQVVAFPQEGIVKDQGTDELLEKALENGADVIGGMPANEYTDEDTRQHVDICIELAMKYDVPVDMHVDETDDPTARSLEYLAARSIDEDLDDGRISAGHVCALSSYDENHARRIIQNLARADMNVITNPPTNLVLQGRYDQHPKRRGITRVDQLLEAGLTVGAGQDCIRDGFYPYGRADMLEVALITAHAAHLQTDAERQTAWDMVGSNPARIMGINYGLEEGNPATFNVFPSEVQSITDALVMGYPPRQVVYEGRIVAKNQIESEIIDR